MQEKPPPFTLNDLSSFFQAWFFLLFIDLGLRLSSFHRVQRIAAQNSNHKHSVDPIQINRVIHKQRQIVNLASHLHFIKATCLPRSLTLQRLLSQRGVHSNLRFGVRVEDGKLEAHAWLERDGVVINEPETVSERFAALVYQDDN